MRDLRVLVSVTTTRAEEKALLRALLARSVQAEIVLSAHTGTYLNGQRPLPDAVLVRNVSRQAAVDTADRFTAAGALTMNSPIAIRACLGKDLQAIMFRRAGIPHPKSLLAFSTEQVEQHVEVLGGRAVVKPLRGSWGRGVVPLRTSADVAVWRAGWEAVDPSGGFLPVLVQQEIVKPGFDLRVLLIGDAPVLAFRRHARGWRTNTALGATVERVDIDEVIAKLCGAVVECLGPGIYGVDLLRCAETGEMFVLEVNTTPEFFHSSRQLGVDISGAIASYVRRVALEPLGGAREESA